MHLKRLADKIPPFLDCEVGLLIDYNCQQALLPREVISSDEIHPYTQRTNLGWSVLGCFSPTADSEDVIGISHRVMVRQVTPVVQPPATLKKRS